MYITVQQFLDTEGKGQYIVNHFDSEVEALAFYESQMNFFEKKPKITLAEVVEVEMKATRKFSF